MSDPSRVPREPAQEAAVDDVGGAHQADDAIRALVMRLSRAHHSGGRVIERAAILAAGADHAAIMSWIAAHAGQPEATASVSAQGGLHGARSQAARTPLRYVLPADALD